MRTGAADVLGVEPVFVYIAIRLLRKVQEKLHNQWRTKKNCEKSGEQLGRLAKKNQSSNQSRPPNFNFRKFCQILAAIGTLAADFGGNGSDAVLTALR